MTFRSKSLVGKKVLLGAFKLNVDQIARIDRFSSLPISENALDWLPEDRRAGWGVRDNRLVFSAKHPQQPQIGDMRVRYEVVQPQFVSVLAQPTQESFRSYEAANGRSVDVLKLGVVPLAGMIDFPVKPSAFGVWILRLIALAALTTGVVLILQPLVSLSNLLQWLRQSVNRRTKGPLVVVAVVLSMALAWGAYGPGLAIALLGVTVVVAATYFGLCRFVFQRKSAA